MAIEVRVPPVLRKVTGGKSTVQASGGTIAAVVDAVEVQFPGFKGQITDGDGNLHRFINVFRNGEDVRYMQQLATGVDDGDVISILPAVAGG
jgi:molybdopterin converting factor small subunit